MKLAIETTLTMDNETAFFSAVWPRVPETQPRITELTEYTPRINCQHNVSVVKSFRQSIPEANKKHDR